MTRTISQRELRNDSGEILRAVQGGEEFVVTRNGTSVATLRPITADHFVPTSRILDSALGLARIDSTRLRADLDEWVDPFLDQ